MLFQGSSRGCGNALPYDERNLKPSKFEKNVDKGTDTFCVSTKSLKNIFPKLFDGRRIFLLSHQHAHFAQPVKVSDAISDGLIN